MSLIGALTALHLSYKRSRYPHRYDGYAGRLEWCLAPPVRFVFRYYQKQRKHRRAQSLPIDHGTRSNPISTKGLLKLRTTRTNSSGQATFDLPALLEQYPTFASISKSLHYVDLKNMLLLSRAVHDALASTAQSYETLRRNSCDQGTETECWGCGSQVCDVGPPSGQYTKAILYVKLTMPSTSFARAPDSLPLSATTEAVCCTALSVTT